jgi:NAD(P)H-dependent FMN reductase
MALAHDSRPPNRPDTLKIVGLGGALRPASSSRAALEVALAGAAGAGAEIELLDLRVLNLPIAMVAARDVAGAILRPRVRRHGGRTAA